MTDPISSINPSALPEWTILQAKATATQALSLADFFQKEPNRYQNLNFKAADLSANLSRHFLDKAIIEELLALARKTELPQAIDSLKNGDQVNFTENRPALHTELRTPHSASNEQQLASQCKEKMHSICKRIFVGDWQSNTGKAITDVVSIGIGGSDLGPRMVAEALTPYHNDKINVHFVTNIDPSDIEGTLANLNPETTLFIVISKSWSTLETLTNANAAKQWLSDNSPNLNINDHFIAVSARPDRCTSFGIDEENILPMWDWVGGRFSLWSAAGLPIALATSFEVFEELLAGAHDLDLHFFQTPLEKNLPALLALLEIWYVNFWGCNSVAVLPYDHTLRLLPNHLQQLAMESNGKSVDRAGSALNYATAPVLWGSAGTIGQHSFHQLLHQGSHLIPVDFILPLNSHTDNATQHSHMVANCLAQAQTLMDGQSASQVTQKLISQGLNPAEAQQLAQHKAMPANRPSTIISFDKLTPKNLGSLIALYEHKTFCASILWNINAFDQWGVELGKTASAEIYDALQDENNLSNEATKAAINDYLNLGHPD